LNGFFIELNGGEGLKDFWIIFNTYSYKGILIIFFREYSNNRISKINSSVSRGNRKPIVNPKFKKMFNDKEGKPDRRSSRGNSFKEDRRTSGVGNREMFDAICSKCKKPCKVPFKPTNGKPVSCSNCFVQKGGNGSRENFQSRGRDNRNGSGGRTQFSSGSGFQGRTSSQRFARTDSGIKELFDAVCSKCKNKCKVPFKPTNGKPVSCSNCFVKKESSGRGRSSFGSRDSGRSSSRDSGRNNNFSRGRSSSRDSPRGRR
jgi:CxxC-x17-CxxC domain-containing protein